MLVASGQQYNNIGEKPTVILYTYYIVIIIIHIYNRTEVKIHAEQKKTPLQVTFTTLDTSFKWPAEFYLIPPTIFRVERVRHIISSSSSSSVDEC